uniref:DUF7651 domain-containing protein n=1 Tax=Vitis vinifera TaxID=29760 RepID=F6HCX3_VITVI
MESLYSSLERSASLTLGNRAEMLSNVDMQSCFLEGGDGCGREGSWRGWQFGGKGWGVDNRSVVGAFGRRGGEWVGSWRFFPDKKGER